MAQPSVDEICLSLLNNAVNATEETNISNCSEISEFLSSTKMPENACRHVVNFFSNFMSKVQHQKELQISKLKELEKQVEKEQGSIEAWNNRIQLMSIAAIQSLKTLLNKMSRFEDGVMGDEFEDALHALVLRYELENSAPAGQVFCRNAMREHFQKVLKKTPTWSYGGIKMWQNLFESVEIDEELKHYYVENAPPLLSMVLENDQNWVVAARRFLDSAENETHNAFADQLLREPMQNEEGSCLEQIHKFLDYLELRKQMQNASVFEELLKNLKLFFGLARRRMEDPKNERKQEDFKIFRESVNLLMCRINKRYNSPRKRDYFSQYYDCVMLATIWVKTDVLNCIQLGISEYAKKNEPIEDYLSLFMIISNMIRSAVNIPFKNSRDHFGNDYYLPNVNHYLKLLLAFHTGYPQFFTQHPSMANEIRELVLENYIQASQRFPDEVLQGLYQTVQKIFEIPANEELRKMEPTAKILFEEQNQDQVYCFNPLYPKINMRLEEEDRPIETRPIGSAMKREVIEVPEGVVNNGNNNFPDEPQQMNINGIPSNSGGTALGHIQMSEMPQPGEVFQEYGRAPPDNAPTTYLRNDVPVDAPVQPSSSDNPRVGDVGLARVGDQEEEVGNSNGLLHGRNRHDAPMPLASYIGARVIENQMPETIQLDSDEDDEIQSGNELLDKAPSTDQSEEGHASSQMSTSSQATTPEPHQTTLNALPSTSAQPTLSRRRRHEEPFDQDAPVLRSAAKHKMARRSSGR
ncbi:Protein CBG27503 [Caenorhabditis briggsae]|uniref:Protein CBG27503 n=1 Tax=Caenorhabditis briggsae TaxID=6238 RepID=B6IF18_CAEBR|nr:Protein CBG27503 [Caenorhabditis briggsae]CAR98498.1 Protein CBG27503 [Caenorhabditis briggsae]